MFEGTAVQPTTIRPTDVRCPICGAGVDGVDSAAVARSTGWTELPGVWLCPECSSKPDIWASVGVEISTAGGDMSVVRIVGIPVMLLPHDQAHAEGVNLRSSFAAFVSAAMAAARRA